MALIESERLLRLGLLLSGGGVAARRIAAEIGATQDFASALKEAGAPAALISTTRARAEDASPEVLKRVEAAGWRWLIPSEPGYPKILTHLSDPPLGLFVCGAIDDRRVRVAIVGSRKATGYGLQVSRMLGEKVAAAGGVVVSGMARGIDAAAHEGALSGGGHTWAVWGTGPDRIYPSEHGPLAERIAESGALITEFPPGTPPRPHHFLQRNRIVAGLCRATVVVEAAARSGALSTARQAIDEDREVFAVPGNIFSEASIGPNALLSAGATPLVSAAGFLESVGLREAPEAPKEAHPLEGILGEDEKLHLDELARRMDRRVEEMLSWLLRLELEGWIQQNADGRYVRTRP